MKTHIPIATLLFFGLMLLCGIAFASSCNEQQYFGLNFSVNNNTGQNPSPLIMKWGDDEEGTIPFHKTTFNHQSTVQLDGANPNTIFKHTWYICDKDTTSEDTVTRYINTEDDKEICKVTIKAYNNKGSPYISVVPNSTNNDYLCTVGSAYTSKIYTGYNIPATTNINVNLKGN